jgi:hypothetical protein
MALSNWDTMAWDSDGNNCEGSCMSNNWVSEKRNSVEIYKNHLNVLAPKMWADDSQFIKPYIAQIQEGEIALAGFNIYAARGPQEAVFTVIDTNPAVYGNKLFFGGIGCYGFNENGGDEFVGVRESTIVKFFEWADSLSPGLNGTELRVWLDKCKKAHIQSLRYNQGDAYIAERIQEEILATPVGYVHGQLHRMTHSACVGQADTPIFVRAIKDTSSKPQQDVRVVPVEAGNESIKLRYAPREAEFDQGDLSTQT